METSVINHPLRTIKLSFDPAITRSEKEAKTLDSYFFMHDEVWRLKTMREENEGRLLAAIARMADLKTGMYPIEQETEIYEAGLGLTGNEVLPEFTETITLDLSDFREGLSQHHLALMSLHAEVTQCVEEHNVFLKEHTRFNSWFEAFADGLLYEIYQEWDSVSVDTASLDDDHQDFLGALEVIARAGERYFDQAEEAFDTFDVLVKDAGTLYRRAEQVDSALHKLVSGGKGEDDHLFLN